jgi:hypothetical protein
MIPFSKDRRFPTDYLSFAVLHYQVCLLFSFAIHAPCSLADVLAVRDGADECAKGFSEKHRNVFKNF